MDCMDGWITWEKFFQIIFVLSSSPAFLSIHTFLVVKVLDYLHYSTLLPSFLLPFLLAFKLCITK